MKKISSSTSFIIIIVLFISLSFVVSSFTTCASIMTQDNGDESDNYLLFLSSFMHYKDITRETIRAVKDSPLDSYAPKIIGTKDWEIPTYNELQENIKIVKTSNKYFWPRVYTSRMLGCCDSLDTDCKGVACSDSPSIRSQIKGIDLWDEVGALSDLYSLLRLSLRIAQETGVPGIVVDSEPYAYRKGNGIDHVAQLNNMTADQVKERAHQVGEEISDIVHEEYPGATLWFLYIQVGGSTINGHIHKGILDRAKQMDYNLVVIEGGELTVKFPHASLEDTKQKLDRQDSKFRKHLRQYPNLKLGAAIVLWENYFTDVPPGDNYRIYIDEKSHFTTKTISDFKPVLEHIFINREYVWIYGTQRLNNAYNEYDAEQSEHFRAVIRDALESSVDS